MASFNYIIPQFIILNHILFYKSHSKNLYGLSNFPATFIIDESVKSAKEILALHLFGMEEDNIEIPSPSSISKIKLDKNQIPLLVDVYPMATSRNTPIAHSESDYLQIKDLGHLLFL